MSSKNDHFIFFFNPKDSQSRNHQFKNKSIYKKSLFIVVIIRVTLNVVSSKGFFQRSPKVKRIQ